MTMDVRTEYAVVKCIYKDVAFEDILYDKKNYKAVNIKSNYLSYFTNWQEPKMNSVWRGLMYIQEDYTELFAKPYTEICDETYYGGTLIETTHPVPGRSSDPCVKSGAGMWSEKIYHFHPDKPPSSDGDEIQTEFFVKYTDMPNAVRDLYAKADLFKDYVQITEIRGVLKDNIPLSPAKG